MDEKEFLEQKPWYNPGKWYTTPVTWLPEVRATMPDLPKEIHIQDVTLRPFLKTKYRLACRRNLFRSEHCGSHSGTPLGREERCAEGAGRGLSELKERVFCGLSASSADQRRESQRRVSDGRRSERRKWWSLHVRASQTGITFEKGSREATTNISVEGFLKHLGLKSDKETITNIIQAILKEIEKRGSEGQERFLTEDEVNEMCKTMAK